MRRRDGFTLIEVIVSIALIGMLSIAFLNIFDTGLRNIDRSGIRTENILSVKSNVDISIMDSSKGTGLNATVILPGDNTETIEGRLIKVTDPDNPNVGIITFAVD